MLEVRILTFEEMQKVYKKRMDELIKVAGSSTHLATMINVSPQNTYGWERRGRISKEGALLVEAHPRLGEQFKAVYLRPDLALGTELDTNTDKTPKTVN